MKAYKSKIIKLEDNQIFCFGSNPIGINGDPRTMKGGSALFALNKKWVSQGEKMNNCLSKSKKSWGIVTIKRPGDKKSLTLKEISENIKKLYDFALKNPDKEFLIAYTGIQNRNLNGWTNSDLAWAFTQNQIPQNIVFEEKFYTLIENWKTIQNKEKENKGFNL